MLKNIHISNYALIDQLDIDLDKGLSIITGETGAGKSILLGALSLILGNRADVAVLKNKDEKCIVEGTFDISNYELNTFFDKNDLDYEQQTILRREINSKGRSRAFINDTPVKLKLMKELGDFLVDIHSQHETLLLKNKGFIISLLDYYSGNIQLLHQYQKDYYEFKSLHKNHQVLLAEQNKQENDLDYHQFLFEELEKADIQEKEQESLEEELGLLSHSEEIKTALIESKSSLGLSETNILSILSQINQSLDKAAAYYDPLKDIATRLKSSEIELEDIQNELENLESNIDFQPQRLEYVQGRINLINSLQQKHNVQDNAELLKVKDDLEGKIKKSLHFDEDMDALNQQLNDIKKQLNDLAAKLSKKRREAASQLEGKLIELLSSVGLDNAKLKFDQKEAVELTSLGKDDIELYFSANKGTELQPIQKIASGGELSRLMLCLKSVKAAHQKLPTIIFDEIDTGVSGNIAHKVGKILKTMADEMQVIAITHLPQIAAKAEKHFVVYKNIVDGNTFSEMKSLNLQERVEEVAKMLSSEKVSDTALKNAEQLIKG